MEGMSTPRGTASPTFDDCVQWYIEATRTSDKKWVADCAVAAWGQAYALAVAKVALEQTVAASGAGAGAGPVAGTTPAREQAPLRLRPASNSTAAPPVRQSTRQRRQHGRWHIEHALLIFD